MKNLDLTKFSRLELSIMLAMSLRYKWDDLVADIEKELSNREGKTA